MMPGMPGAQQVAQMRQARPAGMQQQVRAASMTSRPITGQQPVAVPPQRAGWFNTIDNLSDDADNIRVYRSLALNPAVAEIWLFQNRRKSGSGQISAGFRISVEFSKCRRLEYFICEQFQRTRRMLPFFRLFTLHTAVSQLFTVYRLRLDLAR